MKLYAIEHDTRDNGCGTLNGELFKTFKEAVAKIEQFTHTKHGTSFDFGIGMGCILSTENDPERHRKYDAILKKVAEMAKEAAA